MRLKLQFTEILYSIYAIICSIIFECIFSVFILLPLFIRCGRLDESMRIKIWLYGQFMVRMFRPVLSVSVHGLENLVRDSSSVVVINHRSFTDAFLAPFHVVSNTAICVRAWPFRIPIMKYTMRLARYIDIESNSFDKVLKISNDLAKIGTSFLLYPEGHRSKDGKVLRFQSGAFAIAVANDLPVIPVCMTGSDKIIRGSIPFLRPAIVEITIFPSIRGRDIPLEKRAKYLKRKSETIIREFLGETSE